MPGNWSQRRRCQVPSPGPAEASAGVTLGPVSFGGETQGLDEGVSELLRVLLFSSVEDAIAEEVLMRAEKDKDLDDGYHVIYGELVRISRGSE